MIVLEPKYSRLLIRHPQHAKNSLSTGKDVAFNFFIPSVSVGSAVFGYRSTKRTDGLVFLCEWHVTLHLFVFSVKATLSFNVLM